MAIFKDGTEYNVEYTFEGDDVNKVLSEYIPAVKPKVSIIVSEKAIRPEGENDRCYFCKQRIGEVHDKQCETVRNIVWAGFGGCFELELPSYMQDKDVDNYLKDIINKMYDVAITHIRDNCRKNVQLMGLELEYIDKDDIYLDEEI